MQKVLVANRGEIARRIFRSCRILGLSTVAVFSDADAKAAHVEEADEAHRIGGAPARESYLKVENVLMAARNGGAHAIHPGYGFLSENADFAQRVVAAGLIWVGPDQVTRRITEGQAGAISVVDENHKLIGLVGDYDIRKALENNQNILESTVSRLMNPKPTFIYSDEMAIDALALMQNRRKRTSVLPVTDRERRVVGMLHLSDLVSAGL